MSTHIKFLLSHYIKSLGYVFFIIFSLVIILNTLSEIEFFKNYDVNSYIPIYLALLNSSDLVFEMFPFIFLIATQVFFTNLFVDDQINILKYSGFKNSKIITIISLLALFIGILIVTFFYSFSSNLKNLYLSYKNQYSSDNKYLAVVTKNGLWIRDAVKEELYIINAVKIKKNFIEDVTINVFNDNYDLKKIILSERIDIKSNDWLLYNSTIVEENSKEKTAIMKIFSNFDYEKINNLFSDLSSLSILELYELKKNYENINYSTTEIESKLQKLFSLPFYFTLMTLLSSIIMFNTKRFKNNTIKITIGLLVCVLVYYLNSFFQVLGSTEKISLITSVWLTPLILILINFALILNINEK